MENGKRSFGMSGLPPVSGQLQIDDSTFDLNLTNQKTRVEVTLDKKGLKVSKKPNETRKGE